MARDFRAALSDCELPVCRVLDSLRDRLASSTRVVLNAPTGSGKTSIVPLALADEAYNQGRRVLLLQPRRVAARMAAGRMAELLSEPVGERVGYQVRFDRRISGSTRIEVLTEGLLIRRLQRDPELRDVGTVIFDEFHERSLDTDLALAMMLDAQSALAPEVRILLMSATVDARNLGAVAEQFEYLTAQGRSFAVELEHRPPPRRDALIDSAAAHVRAMLAEGRRGVLVFLPGRREIDALAERVSTLPELRADGDLRMHRLFGELAASEQDAAVRPEPDGRRKLVLATNIAETSLTIDQIDAVVDTGLERRPALDKSSGLTRLVTVPISQASAAQRAGRAGRQGPGRAIRLWSAEEHLARPEHIEPEIRHSDLSGCVLELLSWGVREPGSLIWPEAPPPMAIEHARSLLRQLGGLDEDGNITPLGRRMTTLPVHPRLARMLVMASGSDRVEIACALAAVLEEGDPLPTAESADIDLRVDALLSAARRAEGTRSSSLRRGRSGLGRHLRAFSQLSALVEHGGGPGAEPASEPAARAPASAAERSAALGSASATRVSGLLLSAYPDRLAQRRGGSPYHYRLCSGRGLRLRAGDSLAGAGFLAVADAQMSGADGLVRLAAGLEADDVRAQLSHLIETRESVHWNRSQAVVQMERVDAIGAVVLARVTPSARQIEQRAEHVRATLLDGLRQAGAAALGLDEIAAANDPEAVITRLRCLRIWCPELDLPDWCEASLMATLETWLGPYLYGVRRLDAVRRLPPSRCLRASLSHAQQRLLDEGAPRALTVPSGARRPLEYRTGTEPPVLSVRLQEMFGCTETPRVAFGRIPVVVQLLSPAGRPIQVTQDLATFWSGSYKDVRKDMRGRYPKHDWPEDPLNARPQTGPKRRRPTSHNP
ncbi:MAG: ATP-dependent helicase HrpB [Gammaproteobacteria bacterium]|nr:ATP-dependent helicase HrpB [Gammaproteobacteria bacterium]